MKENEIATKIVEKANIIHEILGPGLFASAYENAMCIELKKEGLSFEQQKSIPLVYKDLKEDIGLKADIIVADKVIVQIKSVETIEPVHHKEMYTYLKFADKQVGLLINFNVCKLEDGITRFENN